MEHSNSSINVEALRTSSEILRALAHPLRMKILHFIDQNEKINVNKIYNTLGLEQSITSQHLRILRNAGLVYTNRDKKFIYYQVNYEKLDSIVKYIQKFMDEEKEILKDS